MSAFKSNEERRKDEERYQADVVYEVWRSGGNPDVVNRDRVQDRYYDGQDYQSAARAELRAQRPRRESTEEDNQNE